MDIAKLLTPFVVLVTRFQLQVLHATHRYIYDLFIKILNKKFVKREANFRYFTITLHPFRNKTLHGLFIAFLFSYSTNKLSLQISKQFISLCSVVLFSQAWQKWTINLNISKLNFLFHLSNFVTLNYKFSSLFGCLRKYHEIHNNNETKKKKTPSQTFNYNACKIENIPKNKIIKTLYDEIIFFLHGSRSRSDWTMEATKMKSIDKSVYEHYEQLQLIPLSLLSKWTFNNRNFDCYIGLVAFQYFSTRNISVRYIYV